jgi:hypothetical protein
VARLIQVLGLSNPTSNYHQRRGGGGGGGGGGGVQSAAMVMRRDLDDNEFPSLQPLAAALDPAQSSRQRSRQGRR